MKYKTLMTFSLCLALTGMSGSAFGQTMSSPNYSIKWDVNDGGGGTLMSTNYTLTDSAAQPTAIGQSASTGYTLRAGFEAAPDDDDDGIKSFMDNCIYDANSSQYDSNADGYGNRCDPDLDNNGNVNFGDYAQLTAAFLAEPGDLLWNPDADMNGDNIINFGDIALFPFFFLGSPGPSALAP